MKLFKFICGLIFTSLLCHCVQADEDLTTENPLEIATTEVPLELSSTTNRSVSLQPTNDANNDVNSDDNQDSDIDTWEPPEWMVKNYPYYLSGYDYEGRPIWISEWGRFDLRKIVEAGQENQILLSKYAKKAARLIHNITMLPSNPLHEANFILDFDGLRIEQFTSIPTVRFGIGLGLEHRGLIEAGRVARVIIINANYVADTFIRLAKTVFGRLFEIVEVYGNNRAVWLPRLLRIFPRDQLPEWYGGTKNHKPVVVYG